jgi:hypothetical protein
MYPMLNLEAVDKSDVQPWEVVEENNNKSLVGKN